MPLRLAWLTDLHLNFVRDEYRLARLADEVQAAGAEAVLIGGDTGEADSFAAYLDGLASTLALPVYFVLGNHDYYHGSIAGVRQTARILSRQSSDFTWLPERGVVHLDERTSLIGHGGWGDGRAGHFLASDVVLNDYLLIEELKPAQGFPPGQPVLTPALLEKLHALGDEAAAHVRRVLPEALQDHQRVILLTHVPPFRQACWHEGQLSDDNWAPHFVCQAVGEVLVEIMTQYPAKQLTVLCGHTHSSGRGPKSWKTWRCSPARPAMASPGCSRLSSCDGIGVGGRAHRQPDRRRGGAAGFVCLGYAPPRISSIRRDPCHPAISARLCHAAVPRRTRLRHSSAPIEKRQFLNRGSNAKGVRNSYAGEHRRGRRI